MTGSGGQPLELALNQDGVYGHGYAVLRLDDANHTAEAAYYVTTQNEPIYTETID